MVREKRVKKDAMEDVIDVEVAALCEEHDPARLLQVV